jgi:hypothetical protein
MVDVKSLYTSLCSPFAWLAGKKAQSCDRPGLQQLGGSAILVACSTAYGLYRTLRILSCAARAEQWQAGGSKSKSESKFAAGD